jgi:hypothetical protein
MKIVDSVISECVFNEQKAEKVWPERNGRNGVVFKKILQVKNGKTRTVINHAVRKSHQLVQFV